MISEQLIYEAYLDCKKNKKKSPGAMEFLFNYRRNIKELTEEINTRSYCPKPSTVFIVTDPKVREVFAADFRDRIIHHLVIKELLPLFEDYFIQDSFSCMPGRGTLAGVLRMHDYMELADREWYVMKMDVTGFFMGIRKSWLSQRLTQFIQDNYTDKPWMKEDLIWLVQRIVLTDPTKGCIRVGDPRLISLVDPKKSLFFLEPDKGLPIGNYSSQMFANFYMTPLDLFIKFSLGLDFYGRYVDDFMMYGPKETLLEAAPTIRWFAKEELDLEVSQDKFYLQPLRHGVKFIGSQIMPGRIYPGRRVISELKKKLYPDPTGDPEHDQAVINSYLGMMVHYDSYNIRREILLEGLGDQWKLVVEPNDSYTLVKTL